MGTLIAWVLVRDHFFGKRAARGDHRHPVRAADDRRRPGAAVAVRPDEPDRRQRRQHAAGGVPRARVRDRCRSSCAPCSRCSKSSTSRPRRPRPRSAPAGSRPSAGSSCRASRRRSVPARRCRSPGRSASTARSCCSRATSPMRTEVTSVRILTYIENGNLAAAAAVATDAAADRARRHRARRRRPAQDRPPWLTTLSTSRRADAIAAGQASRTRRRPVAGPVRYLFRVHRRRLPVPAGRLAGVARRQEHVRRRARPRCADVLDDPARDQRAEAHRRTWRSSPW